MRYQQITSEERHTIAALRRQQPRPSYAEIARVVGRPRCTILREVRRNRSHHDGAYRSLRAQEMTNARRSRSRRNCRLSTADWDVIHELLWADLSPQQVSGRLRLEDRLSVSHETIYKHIWHDKRHGGQLYRRLRQRPKYRKRYGTCEKRGRLAGKRHISERPAAVELRRELGHWEIDTMNGTGSKHCILTLVERTSGCVLIGKLRDHTVAEMNRRAIQLISGRPDLFKTITADNGTEFHGYEGIERATRVMFYFATPYHSWERGTNENTNGLIRQYLPKGRSLKDLSQSQCNEIARILNNRPRKRLGFLTPLERLRQRTLS
jgi:transposase, IS30 family